MLTQLASVAHAQSDSSTRPPLPSEPSESGIFYLVDPTGSLVSLEYNAAEVQGDKIQVKGERSPLRFSADTNFEFAVRLPADAIPTLLKLGADQGWRTVEERRVDKDHIHLIGGGVVILNSVTFGNSSRLLTPKGPLPPGEYCFGIPNAKVAYCFGVDALDASPAGSKQSSAAGMTNGDVIKMVSAGLSPDIVVSSIRQANTHNFDVSVDGLIALKNNKVPDPVIAAMQQYASMSAPQPNGNSNPMTPAVKTPPEPTEEGAFYYVNAANKLARLEPSKIEVLDDRRTLMDGVQAKLQTFGARSGVRLTDSFVAIVVRMPAQEKGFAGFVEGKQPDINSVLLFRRWESIPGARQLWFTTSKIRRGERHTPDPGEFDFVVFKLGENFYKITPAEPLIPGEYCVGINFTTHYCFGIDPNR